MNVIAVSSFFQKHVINLTFYFIHLSPRVKCQIANSIGNAIIRLTFTPNKFWAEIANRKIIKGVIKLKKINKFFPSIKLSTFKKLFALQDGVNSQLFIQITLTNGENVHIIFLILFSLNKK